MGYALTADEQLCWEGDNCEHCEHFKPGPSGALTCPLLSAQQVYAFNGTDRTEPVLRILDLLIPPHKEGYWSNNGDCTMFVEKKESHAASAAESER